MTPLTRIVPFSQSYLAEVLTPGALVVDLTAGNGHDTLFLARTVGPEGTVLSFDLQEQALAKSRQLLARNDIRSTLHHQPGGKWSAGVHLLHAGHERLQEFVDQPVAGAIANLGYLPGSDKSIVTHAATTMQALNAVADLLDRGGRLSVVVYVGHDGGRTEADAVVAWFGGLEPALWDVLRINALNRPEAPFLLICEKK